MSNLQLNQFALTPKKGAVAFDSNPITIPVMIDTGSVNTLTPGDHVKLTTTAGGTILVDKAAATDVSFGVVLYSPKQQSFTAGMACSIGLLGTILWGEANGEVTRGDQLEFVASGTQVKTNAGNPVCGKAIDNAAGTGSIFRYLFLNAESVPATITSGSINGVAIGGSTPAAGAFTTLSATGAGSITGLLTLGAGILGPLTAEPVLRRKINISRANMNTGGQVVVAAVTGKKIRVVDMTIIAIGANAASTANATGVAINGTQAAGTVKLMVSVFAALTRSLLARPGIANNTILADGASFAVNDVSTGITVGADGGTDLITVTSFDVEVAYVLES